MTPIPIYVISLADRNPRRAPIEARLAALNLSAQIVDAIDGRGGLPSVWEDHVDRIGAAKRMQRPMSDAELACALSHRMVQDRFLSTDAAHALILEDDVILDDRLPRFLESGGAQDAPITLLHHLNARVMGRAKSVAGFPAYRLALTPFRAAAYTVNRSAAQALITAQSPVRAVADWPLDLPDLCALALVPEIVGHPPADPRTSALEGARVKRRSRAIADLLTPAYLRRKWRKARSRKVS